MTDLELQSARFIVVSYPLETSPGLALEAVLSPAEIEVAKLVIAGLSNAEIGARRGTSARTIANQVAAVLRKLGLESRRDLKARAFVSGSLRTRA
ncbi:MAG: helix-turn-helix transcriptional regulator [Sandaracinaceae bacterium]|nr:helix-turn-helix transcriptional regulator [Sandaracinaceae bacterium]